MQSWDRRYDGAVGHGVAGRVSRSALDATTAKQVATTLQALAAPSRLLILSTLQDGPRTVGELVEAAGMEQSAVSHQLRLLRHLGLVTDRRHGRHVEYSLYDDHVAALIDQAIYHAEHVRLGATDQPRTAGEPREAQPREAEPREAEPREAGSRTA